MQIKHSNALKVKCKLNVKQAQGHTESKFDKLSSLSNLNAILEIENVKMLNSDMLKVKSLK